MTVEIRSAVRKFQSDAKKAAKAAENAAAVARCQEKLDRSRAAYEEARSTYTGEMVIEFHGREQQPPRPAKQLEWIRHLMAVERKHGLRS